MPTQIKVKRVKGKRERVKIGMSIEFNAADPKAHEVYTAFGVLLKSLLTPAEAQEFMRQFAAATPAPSKAGAR